MLRSFAITLGAIFGLIILVGLTLSSNYNVKRSIEINATPTQIHNIVGDLNQWSKWTPWQKNDPSTQIQVSEVSTGAGASQKWIGGKSGQLDITRSELNYGVDYNLSFTGEGTLTKSSITYSPSGNVTTVSWNMIGEMPVPIIGSYIALIMDEMSGPTLEQGLTNLKEVIEGAK